MYRDMRLLRNQSWSTASMRAKVRVPQMVPLDLGAAPGMRPLADVVASLVVDRGLFGGGGE